MRLKILQEKLAKNLNSVSRIVPSKPQLPVLSNVLLEAKEGSLQIAATDLNLGIRLSVGAKVKKAGSITVPAKVFDELVSSFSPGTVEMTLKGEVLSIVCGSSRASLSGIAASEFPSLGKISKKKEFEIEASRLQESIERVGFAASSDETRPVLSGVLWTQDKDDLKLVATDGYRLSLVGVETGKGKKKQGEVSRVVGEGLIIPSRALQDVSRLIDEFGVSDISVGLVSEQNLVVFSFEDGELTTRLIEGSFPNYSQVIPQDEASVAEIELEGLEKAVRTAAVFARDSANIVRWKMSEDKLSISANSPSYGESESQIDISGKGKGGEIAFNSRYLIDLISVFPSERVKFVMNKNLDPGTFRPTDEKTDFLHLVMPVRVQA